tara:strand:- start:1749 stop:3896 length:2148 start_codon:yes stop_codon:yes gene_type:complete
MTANVYNPQLGDMGSSASTVAPVEDRSVVMAEQEKVSQAQDTANDFNTLTNGMFSIAPIVKEVAANRYVAKNLVGNDGAADVANATQEEVIRQKQQNDVFDLVHVQKTLAVNEIKTFSGLEEARRQGSITWDEMQLRAATQRSESIQRAPLYAEQIDAAYRSVVGGSTGTSSMGQATLWNKTPEEKVLEESRRAVALYADRYNVDLKTADAMIAYDANSARIESEQPKNDADLQNWGSQQVLNSTVQMKRSIMELADSNGNFNESDLRNMNLQVSVWADETQNNINVKVQGLIDAGIVPDAGLVKDMRASVIAQRDSMIALMSNNSQVSFVKSIADMAKDQQSMFIMATLPSLGIAKELGVDLVDLMERMNNNPTFEAYIKTNPAAADINSMAFGDYSNQSFTMTARLLQTVTGTDTVPKVPGSPEVPKKPITQDTAELLGAGINAGKGAGEEVVALAVESGNLQVLADSVSLDPSQVVAYKDTALWKYKIKPEALDEVFLGAGRGVESLVLSSKVRGKKSEYSVWVGDDGKVRMEGSGATSKAIGQAQDLYDTILANPAVWEGDFESPAMYMQTLFEQRKFTVDNKVTQAVKTLSEADQESLFSTVSSDIGAYTTKIEDVEATVELLNQRLMTTPTTFDTLGERQKLLKLQEDLWSNWNNGDPIGEPVDKELEDLLPFMRKVSANTDKAEMNKILARASLIWDNETQTLSRVGG